MASSSSSTLFSTPTIHPHSKLTPSSRSFLGLRRLPLKQHNPTSLSITTRNNKHLPGRRKPGAARAALEPALVISLSTGLSLFLGRFVFFNFQRENVAKQGLPEQNGKTHFEAGDTRAKEFAGILKSNDPVGFNIVDVLAWGSIGHIVAYYILATSSNGYDPSFFG
ncbi:photosystem I reaction center subunit V, chloroplastic [Iris pallida]|uniref:Photosystem I reaction center subunit V, chloroplastic n=1 Tax=Iris pallida TaxID=29817 RepID=A0AAX6E9C4_IRIPA|nr:photosystem I reaction center subunit V, chloroplastic [Iris pallida]